MATLTDLCAETKTFFDRHWWSGTGSDSIPEWKHWPMLIDSAPNYNLPGCYALLIGPEVYYVGLGASKGNARYPDHGIGGRLMAHVVLRDFNQVAKAYKLTEKWNIVGVTSIYTIGLPLSVSYLSAALETYLIRTLKPPGNRRV